PRPPSAPRFPYTTLFRSRLVPSPHDRPLARRRTAPPRTLGAADGGGNGEDSPWTSGGQGSSALRQHRPPPPACGADHRDLLRPRSEEHTSELQSRENLVC